MVASAAGLLLPVQSYNTKSRLNAVFVQMAKKILRVYSLECIGKREGRAAPAVRSFSPPLRGSESRKLFATRYAALHAWLIMDSRVPRSFFS